MIDLDDAHEHCSKHRAEVQSSTACGCFYCLKTYPPAEIESWIEGGQTALCPKCGIDSVIGDASKLTLDEPFLIAMRDEWFGLPDKPTQ